MKMNYSVNHVSTHVLNVQDHKIINVPNVKMDSKDSQLLKTQIISNVNQKN